MRNWLRSARPDDPGGSGAVDRSVDVAVADHLGPVTMGPASTHLRGPQCHRGRTPSRSGIGGDRFIKRVLDQTDVLKALLYDSLTSALQRIWQAGTLDVYHAHRPGREPG